MKSSEVGQAFARGYVASGGNIQTDGRVVYSYQMKIAQRLPNGEIEVIDKSRSPSVTTSKHIGFVLRACGAVKVVQELTEV